MPIYAELHDGRRLEFPDGTDPAVMQATVKKMLGQTTERQPEHPQQEQPAPNSMSVLGKIPGAGAIVGPVEAAAQMATGMVAKPIADIAGLGAMAYDMVRSEKDGNPLGFKNAVQNAMTYQPRTGAGQAVAEYNPLALIAKGVDWLGGKAESNIAPEGSGIAQSALGSGLHEAINQAPQFLGVGARGAMSATGNALKDGGRGMMQSALKPTLESLRKGKAGNAITTLLDEGINVSPGGVTKLQSKVADLNAGIKDAIANSTAIVDKGAVSSRLTRVMNDFSRQVDATSDLAAIQRVFDNFDNHPLLVGNDIPVQLAQQMKQGTYKYLGDKAYGQLTGAEIAAQKALARGLKEEIAAAVPEVRPLNAQESKLINALSVSERRVMMEANKNPLGLGWLTTNPVHMAGWMADRSGLFKSLIARMLNTSGDAVNALAPVGPAAGLAVTEEANRRRNKLATP